MATGDLFFPHSGTCTYSVRKYQMKNIPDSQCGAQITITEVALVIFVCLFVCLQQTSSFSIHQSAVQECYKLN